ncbi:unnamed protein product [Periconia digitata]|uniref:Major facilitator superfamily (MFS) profile domain-containing protein n=1 Tax=Periconia digitata TaxID=1303443 RepID=A0A9W4U9T3_9PLEO|nr:unnamed protein product [Periconia digitata]
MTTTQTITLQPLGGPHHSSAPIQHDQSGSTRSSRARASLQLDSRVSPASNPDRQPGARNNAASLEDQTSRLPFRRLMLVYACLSTTYFTSVLDINSVASALPVIGDSLNAGPSITWAGTAYLMGQAAFQPLYGRLSDVFGRKPVLMMSLGFIAIGGLLCGFAQSPIWLYICRAISGVGGGGVSSVVQIVVSDLVSMRDRGKYQGLLSAAIGLGACTGPFIAAEMLRRGGDSWRWIFWVPPILATLCLLCMWFLLPLKPVTGSWQEKLRKVDWYGLIVAVTAMIFLLLPINSGGSMWPWNSALVISMLCIGAFSWIVFFFIQKHLATLPMIPLELFSRRSTLVLLLQAPAYDWVWQVDLYFLPIYFQQVRGYTPLKAATLLLPLLITQSVAGSISGPLMTKFARYGPVLWTGFALWLLGVGLKVNFSRTTSTWIEVLSLIVEGTGIGFVHQPALVALQASCKPQDRAVATSTRNLMRMLGAVTGLAVSTAVQYAVANSALPGGYTATDLSVTSSNALAEAQMKGVRAIFTIMIPLIALCGIGCFFIPNAVLEGDERRNNDRA